MPNAIGTNKIAIHGNSTALKFSVVRRTTTLQLARVICCTITKNSEPSPRLSVNM
ncbi:MAG: hypothetical protein HZB39_14860 [Planctomycetes bacterium]|nr:hypothetical protein [Planctomycetota bacterium]